MSRETGSYSALKVTRGELLEYTDDPNPLKLTFEFNPSTITRSRTISLGTGQAQGNEGGYDFDSPSQVVRATQGVRITPETFSLKILLDATDRLNAGDAMSKNYGVQPEIDTLRSLVEPKLQSPSGARTLAALGETQGSALDRSRYASLIKFIWGNQTLPVFLLQVSLNVKDYLPNLFPYRAEATLKLQVVESDNPIYKEEMRRQFGAAQQYVASANSATTETPADAGNAPAPAAGAGAG